MKTAQVLVGAILVLAIIFAGLNWAAFTEPGTLDLLIRDVEAPLGIVMLAVVALLSVVFSIALGRIQTGAWLESRRNLKELEQARRIAASKEDSRIRELEEVVRSGFDRIGGQFDQLVARFDSEDVRETIRKEGDEIESRIGQTEKELQRQIKSLRKTGVA